jgi:hypothetical protein
VLEKGSGEFYHKNCVGCDYYRPLSRDYFCGKLSAYYVESGEIIGAK